MQEGEIVMLKAAIVYLTRQQDLWEFIPSLKLLYRNFNNKHNYPVIVFHDDFTPAVISSVLMELNGYLGRIPNIKFERLSFDVPENISTDPSRYAHPEGHPISLQNFSMGYRGMCRFFSGMIMLHPALKDYKYYMRMDSDSYILSPIQVDPFQHMAENGYEYADCAGIPHVLESSPQWKYAGKEIRWAIEGLWETTQEFIKSNLHKLNQSPPEEYDGELYNSNMIIVDMDFFRSQPYREFFNHLDQTGNFYYRRWGDHSVHWLGVRLFMNPSKVLWGMDVMKFCYQHGGEVMGKHYAADDCVQLLPLPFKQAFARAK
jgi:alpha 1,2-mannosyltransferase